MRTFGPQHDTTLAYMGNLARVEQMRGNLDEAERLMRRLVEIHRRQDGDQAQQTLVQLNNLGLLLLDRNQPSEAEPIFQEMLAGVQKTMPAEHWMQGQAKINVAECLFLLHRSDEAERLVLEGYDKLVQTLPAGNDRLQRVAAKIAAMYDAWGKPDQAASWRNKSTASSKPSE